MSSIEELQISELSLGRALAYLSAHQNGSTAVDIKNLNPAELKTFELLKERLDSLKILPHSNIFQQLPQGPCEIANPYLLNNEDVFLEMILLAPQRDKSKRECYQIWKHLNDCYQCFDYFCRVMRGYSLATLEFIKRENGNEK